MANRAASLYRSMKKPDGLWGMKSAPEKRLRNLSIGSYYVSFYEGNRKKFENVGNKADAALAALQRKRKELEFVAVGGETKNGNGKRHRLSEAITQYLADTQATQGRKTYKAYRRMTELFKGAFDCEYLDQIPVPDGLQKTFVKHCKEQGLGDRAVYNNFANAVTFMGAFGIESAGGPTKDWPKYTEPEVHAYREDDLKRLFEEANEEEWLVFQFFLGSMFREEEVSHCPWRQIDLKRGTASVKQIKIAGRAEFDFTPKDHEERTVRLPKHVVAALSKRRQHHPEDFLIFPNEDRKPEGHFLRVLKKLALRAGLNCGHCMRTQAGKLVSCKKNAVCEKWILHSFRKTGACRLHAAGVPARKIQSLLGHSDLETTLRYLEGADLDDVDFADQVETAMSRFS